MPVKINKPPKAEGDTKTFSMGISKGGEGHVSDELKTAVANVLTKNKDGSVSKKQEEIGVVHGTGPFANIGVRAKRTVNLGNFENIQFEVSLFLPSETKEHDINNTFQYASSWVDDKMQELSGKYEPPKE